MFRNAGYVVLAGIVCLAVEAGIKRNRNPVMDSPEVKVMDINEVNEPNNPEVKVSSVNEVNEPNEPEDYKLSISQRGIDFIKRYEDFSPIPYPDEDGFSIGYGHQIRKGENLTSLTEQEAGDLFAKDLKEVYEPIIHKYVKVKLTQGQYDALCSFVYNSGEPRFASSTLLKKLNNGDYKGAAEELNRWININGKPSNGVTTRRAEEKEIFQNND